MPISELLRKDSPAYVDGLKMDKAIQLAKEAGMENEAMALEMSAK